MARIFKQDTEGKISSSRTTWGLYNKNDYAPAKPKETISVLRALIHCTRHVKSMTPQLIPSWEPQRCVPPLHPYKNQLSPKGDACTNVAMMGWLKCKHACLHCFCHLFSDIRGSLPSHLCLSHAHKLGTACTTSINSGWQSHSAHTDCITSTWCYRVIHK